MPRIAQRSKVIEFSFIQLLIISFYQQYCTASISFQELVLRLACIHTGGSSQYKDQLRSQAFLCDSDAISDLMDKATRGAW